MLKKAVPRYSTKLVLVNGATKAIYIPTMHTKLFPKLRTPKLTITTPKNAGTTYSASDLSPRDIVINQLASTGLFQLTK